MPRERDPLSVLYDGFSQTFLDLLRSDLYGWHTATVRSPLGDPIDARGLSRTERAVTRSLYYNLNSTAAAGPLGGRWVKNEAESLQIDTWGQPVNVYTGNFLSRLLRRSGERQRVLRARLASGELARFHVPADGYVFNPAEQSQNLNL